MSQTPSTQAYDLDVVSARRASHFSDLPDSLFAEILSGATRLRVPAGSTLHREGKTSSHCEMVLLGLVRVYVAAVDGRTMTTRYCRPGALLGVASLFHRSFSLPATIQAVTDAEFLSLQPPILQRLTREHPEVALAFLAELSERAMSFLTEIPGSAFASVPQRTARHLLDLASHSQRGRELVARVGQRELAEAVGSVREVVVRALRDFRERGLIETGRRRVTLLDPEGLLDEAHDTEPSSFWNQSR